MGTLGPAALPLFRFFPHAAQARNVLVTGNELPCNLELYLTVLFVRAALAELPTHLDLDLALVAARRVGRIRILRRLAEQLAFANASVADGS